MITFVWFLTSVNSHVALQTAFLCKQLSACITYIWFLTSVNTGMSFKFTRGNGGLVTQFTREKLRTRT